jgi:hypothetical protein
MKRWPWAIALIALLTTSCIIMVPDRDWSNPRTEPDDRNIDRTDYGSGLNTGYFYDYLAPYGTWIRYPDYGYVWIPRNMGYRWRPYTHGHWIWSNFGWTWISDFDWGWAVFHYGRWGFDDRVGWFWVPGTTWGPAWVVWRSSDLYFGWAPLPPGVEWRPRYGFGGPFDVPDDYWIFVEGRYFLRDGLHGYALPPERNRTIVRMSELHQNIRFRNDDVVNEGIDREVVRRVTRETLGNYELRNADRPGRDRVGLRDATLYRPEVKPDEKAVPKKFIERDKADETIIRDPGENETIIRRRHDEENKILERTQTEEVRDLNRRFVEKSTAVKDAADKAKLKKDQDAQVQELKKKHDEEKAAIQERQKKDTEVVRKGAIKKVEKKIEK